MGFSGNNLVLTLDFQIVGTESQSEKFEESISLNIAMDRPAWSAPKVTSESLLSVQDQLQTWRDKAEQWLSCQSINPSVTAVYPQQVQINLTASIESTECAHTEFKRPLANHLQGGSDDAAA